jgi:hypothetical protein
VYRLYRFLSFLSVLAVLGLSSSCNKPGTNLVQIQQQRSGDYSLALFNDNGVVKQHSNRLVLEVRNASTNEPADVNNLQVQASMRMPGMGPMFGTVSTTRKTGPGRYEFDAEFSMAGQWSCLVTFDPSGRAQFNLNAQ